MLGTAERDDEVDMVRTVAEQRMTFLKQNIVLLNGLLTGSSEVGELANWRRRNAKLLLLRGGALESGGGSKPRQRAVSG